MDDLERQWRADLRQHYPDWGTPQWEERWQTAVPPAQIGDELTGKVISRAGFGVWVDAGIDCPALLLVTEIGVPGPLKFEDYPRLGEEITARVRSVGLTGEVSLTQRAEGIET